MYKMIIDLYFGEIMTRPAIPDVISVVGSAYLQPIADLLENLLKQTFSGKGPAGVACMKMAIRHQ